MEKARLAGAKFRPPAEIMLAMFSGDDVLPVTLKRETDNRHDRNAIAVWIAHDDLPPHVLRKLLANASTLPDPFQIGYVAATWAAEWVAALPFDGDGTLPADLMFEKSVAMIAV